MVTEPESHLDLSHTRPTILGHLVQIPGDKVPLYREAFRLYVESETPPTPSDLAAKLNLHPAGICTCMDKQHWAAARIMFWSAKHAVNNVHLDDLAAQVQDQLCGALQSCYRVLLPALAETTQAIAQLPVAPPTSGPKRGKSVASLSKVKVELLRTCAKTLDDVTASALALGLAVPVRGRKEPLPMRSAGMTDLSITLSQALAQDPAKVSTVAPDPAAPVEFDVDESAGESQQAVP